MARIPIIIGQHISRHGQARATINPESRIDRRFTKTPRQWVDTGVWAGVKSSNVRKIRYDKYQKKIFVMFKNNAVYWYGPLNVNQAKRFFNGGYDPRGQGSFGRSVWALRRKGFPGVRV